MTARCPTYEGGTYQARLKLGKASVYFLWDVTSRGG